MELPGFRAKGEDPSTEGSSPKKPASPPPLAQAQAQARRAARSDTRHSARPSGSVRTTHVIVAPRTSLKPQAASRTPKSRGRPCKDRRGNTTATAVQGAELIPGG